MTVNFKVQWQVVDMKDGGLYWCEDLASEITISENGFVEVILTNGKKLLIPTSRVARIEYMF